MPNHSKPQSIPQSEASIASNPFFTPGACRRVIIQSPSPDGLLKYAKNEFDKRKVWAYEIGIYRLKNNHYIAASTMQHFKTHRSQYTPSELRRRKDGISSAVARGDYHPTSRCTDGSDIVFDTGQRVKKEGKVGTHLFYKVAAATVKAARAGSKETRATPMNRKYEALCRNRKILDVDDWKRIPLGSCSGDTGTCQRKFENAIDLNSICKSSFGSEYSIERVTY